MNMDIHRVSNIKVNREEYSTFQTVSISVFTEDGVRHTLTLYTDEKLELENKDD